MLKADEVILMEREGGKFYECYTLSLAAMGGVVPVIGDRLTVHPPYGGLAAYDVVARFLSEMIPSANPEDRAVVMSWVLVVEPIDLENEKEWSELLDFDRVIRGMHDVAVTYIGETVHELDRSNRDPAYWTKERKELLRQEREARLAEIKAVERRD